ncbi:MAG: hypothetical protein NC916_00655, partial [Candidatus Omnitrophica bacterium]|nr:hypothetical protein [Candidatus Omnitrophota bacterium]
NIEKIEKEIARQNLKYILGDGTHKTQKELLKTISGLKLKKEAYLAIEKFREDKDGTLQLPSRIYSPRKINESFELRTDIIGKIYRKMDEIRISGRSLLNKISNLAEKIYAPEISLEKSLQDAKERLRQMRDRDIEQAWKNYQDILFRIREKSAEKFASKELRDFAGKMRLETVEEKAEALKFIFDKPGKNVFSIKGDDGKIYNGSIEVKDGKPIFETLKIENLEGLIKINESDIEYDLDAEKKLKLETLRFKDKNTAEGIKKQVKNIINEINNSTEIQGIKVIKTAAFIKALQDKICKLTLKDKYEEREIQKIETILQMLTEPSNLEAAMAEGKTIPAVLALGANKLVFKDSASLYLTKNTALVSEVIKQGEFWLDLCGLKLRDLDSLISAQTPTSMLKEIIFSKDKIMVGSAQGIAHLWNRRMASGLERERVDNLIESLKYKDNLKILDEVQNLAINHQEAIVGKGGEPLLSSHFKFKEHWDKLYELIEVNKELSEITRIEAAKAMEKSSPSPTLEKMVGEKAKVGYYREPTGRINLTEEAFNFIKGRLNDPTLKPGEIRGLVEGIVNRGEAVAITRDGRVIVGNRYEGAQPELINHDAALMYSSARWKEKIDSMLPRPSLPRIDWVNSMVGGETIISTDALRVITEIGGRTVSLSGTLEPYKEIIRTLNGSLKTEKGKIVRFEINEVTKTPRLVEIDKNGVKTEIGKDLFHAIETSREDIYKATVEGIKKIVGKKGGLVLISAENLYQLKDALRKSGLMGEGKVVKESNIYDTSTYPERKKALSEAVRNMGKNKEIIIATEIAIEGVNADSNVDSFIVDTGKFDLSACLQAFRRINRDTGKAKDTVNFYFQRSALDKFLQDNSPVKDFVERRWKKEGRMGKSSVFEKIKNIDNPGSLTDPEAIVLALNLREEINRSHHALMFLNRALEDAYIRKPFERFMEYVYKNGTIRQKEFISKIYQEVILDRNSELYTSFASYNISRPQDIGRQALENISGRIETLYDVISGHTRSEKFKLEKGDYEPTSSKLKFLAGESPFRKDSIMRSRLETDFRLKDWQGSRLDEIVENRFIQSFKEDREGNKSPPALSGLRNVEDAVRLTQFLADTVLIPTIRTSSNFSEPRAKEVKQINSSIKMIEGLLGSQGIDLGKENRALLESSLDGLRLNSFSPRFLVTFTNVINNLSTQQNNSGNQFLTSLKEALNFSWPNITGNIINDAFNVKQVIDLAINRVTSVPNVNLTVSQTQVIRDLTALAVAPVVEMTSESNAFGYNRIAEIANRKLLIESIVGKDKADAYIASLPYETQQSDWQILRSLQLNQKGIWQAASRFKELYYDKGAQNVHYRQLVKPIKFDGKLKRRELSKVIAPPVSGKSLINLSAISVPAAFKILSPISLIKSLGLLGSSFAYAFAGVAPLYALGKKFENANTWVDVEAELEAISKKLDTTPQEKEEFKNYLLSLKIAAQTAKKEAISKSKGKYLESFLIAIRPLSPFGLFYTKFNAQNANKPLDNLTKGSYKSSIYAQSEHTSTFTELKSLHNFFASLDNVHRANKIKFEELLEFQGLTAEAKIAKFQEMTKEQVNYDFSQSWKRIKDLESENITADLNSYIGNVKEIILQSHTDKEISLLNILSGTRDIIDEKQFDDFVTLFESIYQDIKPEELKELKKSFIKQIIEVGAKEKFAIGKVDLARDTLLKLQKEYIKDIIDRNRTKDFSKVLNTALSRSILEDLVYRGVKNLYPLEHEMILMQNDEEIEAAIGVQNIKIEKIEKPIKLIQDILGNQAGILLSYQNNKLASAVKEARDSVESKATFINDKLKNLGKTRITTEDELKKDVDLSIIGILKLKDIGIKDVVGKIESFTKVSPEKWAYHILAKDKLAALLGKDRNNPDFVRIYIDEQTRDIKEKIGKEKLSGFLKEFVETYNTAWELKFEAEDKINDLTLTDYQRNYYRIASNLIAKEADITHIDDAFINAFTLKNIREITHQLTVLKDNLTRFKFAGLDAEKVVEYYYNPTLLLERFNIT